MDPPIKQGQTRYHFLILEFSKDEEIELELGLTEYGYFLYFYILVDSEEMLFSDVLNEKFPDGQLTKQMKGPLYEVVSRIMKALVKKRITVPGSFIG